MKTTMLLLVPALALLVSLTVAKPLDKLRRIHDLAETYNETLTEDNFVEDVSVLAENDKCGKKFFCKVYKILEKHERRHKRSGETALVRNLETFLNSQTVNCTEVLKKVTASENEKPITDLLGSLNKCIENYSFKGTFPK